MHRTYRTMIVFAALNISAIGRADEPAAVGAGGTADAPQSAPSPAGPTLQWKKGVPSPFARVESPAAVVKGKLHLFGGFTEDLQASNQVDVYDPASDSWTRLKDMPTRLTHLNPALDGPTIWFAGGFKGKHPGPVTSEVWKYDAATDTWAAAAGTARGGRLGGCRTQSPLLRRLQSRSSDRCQRSLEFAA